MTITFDAPPLDEVAVGVSFLRRPDFLLPYYGDFWARIKESFPEVKHADPSWGPDDEEGDDPFILPRVWFLSPDSALVIQVQQNRFHFNWRRVEGQGNEYIRFERVEPEFLRLWKLFNEYVEEKTGQALQPTAFELTYVNYIASEGVVDTFELAQKAFKGIAFPPAPKLSGQPRAFAQHYNTLLKDEAGMLTVQLVSAKHRATGEAAVKFELAVRGKHTSEMPFEKGISFAHDVIVGAFEELTTSEMHSLWGLRKD